MFYFKNIFTFIPNFLINERYGATKRIAAILNAIFFAMMSTVSNSQTLFSTYYTSKDGLLSGWVTALAQDSHGFLWIGTAEGLCRFDGTSFVNFTTKDGLAHGFVDYIAESNSHPGHMLIGTRGGLTFYHNGAMHSLRFGPPESPLSVTRILFDRHGTTWLGTDDGLYLLKDSSAQKFHTPPTADIADLAESKDGTLFIAGRYGLLLVHPDRKRVQEVSLGLRPGKRPSSLCADEDGSMWVGTDDSLLLHMKDSTVVGRFDMKTNWIPTLLDNGDGTLWGCSEHGLFHIWKRMPEQATIAFTAGASRCMYDREGNLWLAGMSTQGAGLYKLTSPKSVMFSDSDATTGGRLGTVIDKRHHIWGIAKVGLWEYWQEESGGWRRALHKTEETQIVSSLSIDSQDRLWANVYDSPLVWGYAIVDNGTEPSDLHLIGRYNITCSPMYSVIGKREELWIFYEDLGLVRFDTRKGKVISRPLQLPANSPRCTLFDNNGLLWVGEFSTGLYHTRIDSMFSWRVLTVADGLPDNCVRSLCNDNEGSIWIGTRYGGAAVYRNGKIESFDIKDGLPSNWVISITQDSSGRIWFCTSLGLAYLEHPSEKKFRTIPQFHGEGVGRIVEVRKGLFGIRTLSKFILYDFKAEGENTASPMISISDFEMNGKLFDADSVVEFPHDQNLFSVSYLGIFFKEPRGLRYVYKLEGVDELWQGPTERSSITYSGLQPGNYVFSVKAIGGNGIESPQAASLRFVIAPAFWDRWWFRVTGSLMFGSLVWLFYYRRVSGLKRQRIQQESFSRQLIDSQEQERKRIAAELHDGLGQELLIIKNKALLGLQSTDADEKQKFLEDISSTASETLDETSEIAYSLHPFQLDRLGLTKALMALVRRASGSSSISFTHTIDNADGLFTKEFEINLYRIIQEGINNILKHSGASEAHIVVRRETATLIITIEDNGKGFDLAVTRTEQRGMGMTGLTERTRILGATIDIVSEPGKGTRLSLTIPLKET